VQGGIVVTRTRSPNCIARLHSLRLLLVPLLFCAGVGAARADDDPEPPKPTGEIAQLFARVKVFARVDSKEFDERNKATGKLYKEVGPQQLDEVIWWSKRGSPVQRELAYRLLCYFRMQKASEEQIKGRIVPALLAGTRDRNLQVRRTVTYTMHPYAKHSKEVIARLFELLDDPDRTQIGYSAQGADVVGYSVAGMAVHSLRRVQRLDKRIVPLLWDLARKGELRKPALVALGDLGLRDGMAGKVLPLLGTVFCDKKEDVEIRAEAAAGLYNLGWLVRHVEIFPLVCRVMQEEKLLDPAEADEKGAYAVLSRCMSIIVRECMSKDGNPALFKEAVPALVKIFEKDAPKVRNGRRVDYDQRERAINTLKRMGPSAKAAVPALQAFIRDLSKRGARYSIREEDAEKRMLNYLLMDAEVALKQIDK
jgi:hypothetical protein